MADKHGSGKVLNLTKGGGVDGGAGDGGVVGLEDRKPIGLHLPTPFIAWMLKGPFHCCFLNLALIMFDRKIISNMKFYDSNNRGQHPNKS